MAKSVMLISISGHGNSDGGWIGKDWFNLESFPLHAVDLVRIKPYFAPGASVRLIHCMIGLNSNLLRVLSNLWGGEVKVIGGTRNQVAGVPWLVGRDIVCHSDRCKAK